MKKIVLAFFTTTVIFFTSGSQAQSVVGSWDLLDLAAGTVIGKMVLSSDGSINYDGMIGSWSQSGNHIKATVYGNQRLRDAGTPIGDLNFDLSGNMLHGSVYVFTNQQTYPADARFQGSMEPERAQQQQHVAQQPVLEKSHGESARGCVSASGSNGKVTFTNNCGEKVFVIWCGDLTYSKRRCGDGPSGGFYTESDNIPAGDSRTADINGQYHYGACKGGISFGNDGNYRDDANGGVTCLKKIQ